MSENLDKAFKLLDKFHGKAKTIKLTTDDGSIEEVKIYPLPNKHLPIMLKLQRLSKQMVRTADGKLDEVNTPSQVIDDSAALNIEIARIALGHSICVQNGINPTPQEFDEILEKIGSISSASMGEIINAIAETNDVPLNETKKSEVLH
jgi:hypothetical protein